MSTPPLLSLPSSSCIASVVMTLTRAVGVTQSPFTFEEQSYRWPGEMWSMEFALPPIVNRAVAAEWKSFALKLEGQYGRFLMGDPSARLPAGSGAGTPLVNGINQTGNTLVTDGWTPNQQGALLPGDYIQLGTGASSKLHMVTNTVNSDGAGNATLEFVPALRTSPADNAPIVISDAKGVFKLTNNSFSWQVSPGGIYRISFSAQEVVSA